MAEGDGVSAPRGGKQLASGKGEEKLVAEGDAGGGGSVEEDEFEGGFGSLDSMLQWAIGTEKSKPPLILLHNPSICFGNFNWTGKGRVSGACKLLYSARMASS